MRVRTGKGLKAWAAILDRWGAATKGHAATARYLRDERGLTPWWSQMVTVAYERERGLRVVGQRSTKDFMATVSRVVKSSPEHAFTAFVDPNVLSTWFTTKAKVDLRVGGRYSNADGDTGVFKVIDPFGRLVFTWENPEHCPGTLVGVRFDAKPGGKVTIGLGHSGIATKREWKEMKQGWSWALDSLKSYLETGRPITHEAWLARRSAS
jgi:uncharacterized protein YndB with AHSA1/START domain